MRFSKCTFLYPLNGGSVSRNSTFTIPASALDNVAVSKVEFYVDGGLRCSDTLTPYECAAKIGGKLGASHSVMVKAYDSSGNFSLSSVNVTVR